MISAMELLVLLVLMTLLAVAAPTLGTDSRNLHDPVDSEAPRPGLW